ncbi:MAG: hypothetical protein DMF68_12545 [Acidobacteria bacterium]|nr:MAG: hypothetical protein DMF68_12545 [Acidobacteriota bacterium]
MRVRYDSQQFVLNDSSYLLLIRFCHLKISASRLKKILLKSRGSIKPLVEINIPFDVEKTYGTRGRVPVRGTINGYLFRSSIFRMGGDCHFMVVNKGMREGAKVKAGDTISVVMERDDEPRVIWPLQDFARALKETRQRTPLGRN